MIRKRLSNARNKHGKDIPISRDPKKGLITQENLRKVSERWNKRKGYQVMSYDHIVKNIRATSVATRFAQKDILKALERFKLAARQKNIIGKLIDHREHYFTNTDILVRPDKSLYFIELLNSLGEKKTGQVLHAIERRSVAIQKMSRSEIKKSGQQTDVFQNIPQVAGVPKIELEIELLDKKELLGRINNFIKERKKHLESLRNNNYTLSEIDRNRIIRTIRDQTKEAIIERTKFQAKYDLPF